MNGTSTYRAAWWGRKIAHLREKRCLTQEELAEAIKAASDRPIELTRAAISRWEHGQFEPALKYRRPLARALEVDFDLLFAEPPEGWAA